MKLKQQEKTEKINYKIVKKKYATKTKQKKKLVIKKKI